MVNIAIIGAGNMGRNHARTYSNISGAKLVSISDVNEGEKAIADRYGCRFYTDYREMLEKEDIDAVSVCAPTKLHCEIAVRCMRAGKHVLIEKPIATNVQEARRIVKEAGKAGVTVTVGHIERFNPAVRKLKELVERKKLGRITSLISRRVGIFPPQIKDANVFQDLAVHDIDIFNYLLEVRPTRIYSHAGNAFKGTREDHAIILLDYQEVPCVIQVNWITPVKIRELAVTGLKGYAELNYISQDLKVYKSIYEKTYDTFGDFVVKFGSPEETKIKVRREEPLMRELRHFVECVKTGSRPLVSAEDGLLALELALDAVKSYRTSKEIRV